MSAAPTAGSFPALVPFGWDERVVARYLEHHADGREPARVVRVDRDRCTVRTAEGERSARAESLPAVGDWVALHVEHEGDHDQPSGAQVVAVVDRWSSLERSDPHAGIQVLAADLDIVFVVTPADRSSVARVEREMVLAWDSGARPVIVVSKQDVAPVELVADLERRLVGVDVVPVSARSGTGLDRISDLLQPHRTAVLLGPSGAGKSTLANVLLGAERFATGEVRHVDARGRHTTSTRELVIVPGGGVLIDTPGLRSLGLGGGESDGIAATFSDIEGLAAGCRFRDCTHEHEPGCAVQAAAEAGVLDADRLASYRKLKAESDFEERRTDPVAARAQKQQSKTIHKTLRDGPQRGRA